MFTKVALCDGNAVFIDVSWLSAPTSMVSGRMAVPTAGTAVPIIAITTGVCKMIQISADLGNADSVVIGDSTVVASNGTIKGIPVLPGEVITLHGLADISNIYVDAQTNGDAVCYNYFL